MSDDLAPRLQRSLGDAFALERELGGGGMSRVFLARDAALDRRVVVKVLDLEGTVAASAERFRREVKVIAQLQHPHIVPVLTAGGDDTLLWYVMPYVAGESLRARLVREGALPLGDALRIARELLDALAFAHERGVVHRDVKPENILLEGRHAVVADFGVAKALSEAGVTGSGLTSVGMALGTPAYMAPEQAMADATTNHRADLYAAGVVLYEMLAGAPPFTGNAQAVVAAHLSAQAPRIEERRGDIPPAVGALLPLLLAKNPAERPQSALEVATVLESAVTPTATAPGTATPNPDPARAPDARPAGLGADPRRARRRTLVLAGAVLVLVVGIVWAARDFLGRGPVVRGTDLIAVFPPGASDPSLRQLGNDLVVTLSTGLDGVGAIRTVDASTVLQSVRGAAQPLSLADARRLAARMGAHSLVHGSVLREGPLAIVELQLYRATGGDAIARTAARAPADSVRVLSDSLARTLLAAIWRSGTPPSSLLSEVATPDGEALRAFLAGEAAFDQNRMQEAIGHYARAAERDSNFAQAWLRLDYARAMILLPPDSAVRAHLFRTEHRLPARERDWMDLRFSRDRNYLQNLERGRLLAARYPESYGIQYLVADGIVHAGPRYGIAISEALPLLERLEMLAPENPDIPAHRAFVAFPLADTAMALAGLARQAELIAAANAERDDPILTAIALTADAWRTSTVDRQAEGFDRSFAGMQAINPEFPWYPYWGASMLPGARRDSLWAATAATRTGRAFPEVVAYQRAISGITRGDAAAGLRALAAIPLTGAPAVVRTAAAREAAILAWFGLVGPEEAEAAMRSVERRSQALPPLVAAEVAWADGLLGIAVGDSMRFAAGVRAVRGAGAAEQGEALARSLRALWRERRTGAVDSLRALEEELIATGVVAQVPLPVHRAVLGRALLRAGDPAGAERYLQWPDNAPNSLRLALVTGLYGHLTRYERGLAAEQRGDTRTAIRHFTLFVHTVDRPPPSLQSAVDDAHARLARLQAAAR